MINPTVRELIELLKEMDQDAIVCIYDPFEKDNIPHATIEICNEMKDTRYVDNNGDEVVGNIVSIYG
jgi:hypothetical protein